MHTRSLIRWGSLGLAVTSAIAAAHSWWRPCPPDPYQPSGDRRPIDLVVCLDTSGSMTALIDSARAKLWDIVNQLAKARPLPHLRVGLLTYGSPHVSSASAGWVVRQMDLTDDLDGLYARLMSFTTNGGDEYVGWVLNDALKTMSWSRDPAALKLIFVAGNESADQAAEVFNFRAVAERVRSEGIIINAIYCGNYQVGLSEKWQEVAQHGGGDFSAIDMKFGTVQIPTPYDQQIMELNLRLNATYVPFGRMGSAGCGRQSAMDAGAEQLGVQSAGSRVAAKASPLYDNSDWDLVDAYAKKKQTIAALRGDELPPAMRSMSMAEREQYVTDMQSNRVQIQEQIRELNSKRENFVAAERKKQPTGPFGLDDAVLQSLRAQAQAKGFQF